ncbi:MAG TPA: rod shape-determining protein MreC [Pedococcus sp.]|nr:rod shape-determining protein MreC [Pedococcus sp.]
MRRIIGWAPGSSSRSKPGVLAVLLVLTTVMLVADLAGHPAIHAVRSVSGAALGPVQRFLSGARPAETAALAAENARLRAEANVLTRQVEALAQVQHLVGSPFVADHSVVIGQVVASERSPVGGRSVTVDVGTRDGVTVDSTVVSARGLVGRIVAASPWTSDVQLLGAPQSVVATRVGDRGLVGTVAPVPAGGEAARAGELSLTVLQPGVPQVGDVVRTLGSVGGRPYAPGIMVGRVVAVDPQAARGTVTGRVMPAVDLEGIDVVAVLVPDVRDEQRPLVRGGAGADRVADLAEAG